MTTIWANLETTSWLPDNDFCHHEASLTAGLTEEKTPVTAQLRIPCTVCSIDGTGLLVVVCTD